MKKLLLIAIMAIVIVGLVFVYTGAPSYTPQEAPRTEEGAMTEKPPTGNVDDAAQAILNDADTALEAAPAESDPSLVSEDQELNDFGQSFDPTQL